MSIEKVKTELRVDSSSILLKVSDKSNIGGIINILIQNNSLKFYCAKSIEVPMKIQICNLQ